MCHFDTVLSDVGQWFIAMYSKESKNIKYKYFDLASDLSNVDRGNSKGILLNIYCIFPSNLGTDQ